MLKFWTKSKMLLERKGGWTWGAVPKKKKKPSCFKEREFSMILEAGIDSSHPHPSSCHTHPFVLQESLGWALHSVAYLTPQGCNGPIEIRDLWSQEIANLCVSSIPPKSPKRPMKEQRVFVIIVLVRITPCNRTKRQQCIGERENPEVSNCVPFGRGIGD